MPSSRFTGQTLRDCHHGGDRTLTEAKTRHVRAPEACWPGKGSHSCPQTPAPQRGSRGSGRSPTHDHRPPMAHCMCRRRLGRGRTGHPGTTGLKPSAEWGAYRQTVRGPQPPTRGLTGSHRVKTPRGPSLHHMVHLQMARGAAPESPPITGVPDFLSGVGLGCQKWGGGTVVSMATEKQVGAPWEEAGAQSYNWASQGDCPGAHLVGQLVCPQNQWQ